MQKSFYNLSSLVTLITLFALSPRVAIAEVTVPAIGSIWKSEVKHLNLSQDATTIKRAEETMTVARHENGVPVFDSEVFGYKGEIRETTSGTVVYTDKCKELVPKEIFVAPENPNQCGWHLCSSPAEGVTITRNITVFAELYSCFPTVGKYSYTTIGKAEVGGEIVAVGDAEVSFGLFKKTKWMSYISAGRGEVYAESNARKTIYSKVEVSQVFFVNANKTASPVVAVEFAKAEEKTQCDVVAFGDSLTEGMGASKDESYPSVLSGLLGKEICNMGISGNTTRDAKERLSQILALKPKIIFIALGANDVLKGISPTETKNNLSHIVDTLSKEGVMLLVLGFEDLKVKKSPETIASLSSVNEVMSGNKEIIYLPSAFAGILDDEAMLSKDGMHPNAAGYKKLAHYVHDEAFGALQILPGFVVRK